MQFKSIKRFIIISIVLAIVPSSASVVNAQLRERHQNRERHISISQNASISVVTSLPCYASITQYLGDDLVTVQHIAAGKQDPHFVQRNPAMP